VENLVQLVNSNNTGDSVSVVAQRSDFDGILRSHWKCAKEVSEECNSFILRFWRATSNYLDTVVSLHNCLHN
jgi:hypothetical protein